MRSNAVRVAFLAIMTALAITLSLMESLLPSLPVPGAKLGLSNVVIMAVLSPSLPFHRDKPYWTVLSSALAIALAKSGLVLLRGGLTFWMSFCGGILSTLIMALCLYFFSDKLGFIGVGIAGAIAHNTGQLMAAVVLFDTAMLYYGPWLLIAAVVTGTLTGYLNHILFPKIQGFLKG